MNEWTDEWMNEWIDERPIKKRVHARIDGVNERTSERKNERTNEWMNEWMNEEQVHFIDMECTWIVVIGTRSYELYVLSSCISGDLTRAKDCWHDLEIILITNY